MDHHPDNKDAPEPKGNLANQPIDSVKALKDRCPAMFSGEYIGFEAYCGWFALLVKLCVDIDGALDEKKSVFRWV